MLGFYVNIVLPFLRLGEIARAYALNYQTGMSKIQSISTLVVEKVLEAVFLGLTVVALIPFLVLSVTEQESNPGLLLGIVVNKIYFGLSISITDWVAQSAHPEHGLWTAAAAVLLIILIARARLARLIRQKSNPVTSP